MEKLKIRCLFPPFLREFLRFLKPQKLRDDFLRFWSHMILIHQNNTTIRVPSCFVGDWQVYEENIRTYSTNHAYQCIFGIDDHLARPMVGSMRRMDPRSAGRGETDTVSKPKC